MAKYKIEIPVWVDLNELDAYNKDSTEKRYQVKGEDGIFIVETFHKKGSKEWFPEDCVSGYFYGDERKKVVKKIQSLRLHPIVKKEQKAFEKKLKLKEKQKLKEEKKKRKQAVDELKKWQCKVCNKRISPRSSVSHLKNSHKMSMNEYKDKFFNYDALALLGDKT